MHACWYTYTDGGKEIDRIYIYIYILHTQRHLYVKKTYVYIYIYIFNTLYTDRANVALPGCMKTFGFRLTTD